jgi:hypothetical protein
MQSFKLLKALVTSNMNLKSKRFVFFVVSGLSLVVAHMMATGGLHGR